MADQKEIILRPGDATPKDIVLRELPVADVATTTIYLRAGDASPKDVVLRNPLEVPVVGGDASITGAGQIASAEAIGSPTLALQVEAAGISSEEAFGAAVVGATVAAVGIDSSEAFGQPAIGSAAAEIVAAGVPTEEAFGAPTIEAVAQTLTGAPYKRKGYGWRPWKEREELEIEEIAAPQDGPNALLTKFLQDQHDKLAAEAHALQVEQAAAQAKAAVQKAQKASARAQALRDEQARQARAAQVQAEMQRIEQEIEELDVAYLVALMD